MEQWQRLHSDFTRQNYKGKLLLFDEIFCLVPFSFPAFSPSLSWVHDPKEIEKLSGILHEEKTLGRALFERTVSTEDQQLTFTIFPAQRVERDCYHDFILHKFFLGKEVMESKILQQAPFSSFTASDVRTRIDNIDKIIKWMQGELNKNSSSLFGKFLQILYSGATAPALGLNSKTGARRKFIELYLYSQGLLLSDHRQWLTRQFNAIKNERSSPFPACSPLVIKSVLPMSAL